MCQIGLPNMIPEGEVDNHTYRMLLFALHCIQVFSGRYDHPNARALVDNITARNAIARHQHHHIRHSSRAISMQSGSTTSSDSTPQMSKLQSRCAMRYGIALGAVTVGVLQGKCPAFDVWGKTVNLASRMEVN